MNNDSTTEKNATTKAKALNILGYALRFLVGFAIVLGINSCVKSLSMPEEFKEAEKILKKEGFSCRYVDKKEDFEDLFDSLDIDAEGAVEVLVALDEDSKDCFFITRCDDVYSAKDLESEWAWKFTWLTLDDYTTKVNYRTVYCGHKDLIASLLD